MVNNEKRKELESFLKSIGATEQRKNGRKTVYSVESPVIRQLASKPRTYRNLALNKKISPVRRMAFQRLADLERKQESKRSSAGSPFYTPNTNFGSKNFYTPPEQWNTRSRRKKPTAPTAPVRGVGRMFKRNRRDPRHRNPNMVYGGLRDGGLALVPNKLGHVMRRHKREELAKMAYFRWKKKAIKLRGSLPNDWPKDLRKDNVQMYLKEYMLGQKNTIPWKTADLFVDGNNCNKKVSELSKSQALLYAAAKGLEQSTNRGILAWHSTGSGKTFTSACVMHAYWNSTKPIVFVSSIEGLKSNPPSKYINAFQTFFRTTVNESQFAKRVKMFTFAQIAHYLQLHNPSGRGKSASTRAAMSKLLNDAILIIDEVQNLFHPLKNQVQEHKKFEKFLLTNRNDTKQLKIIILTATPGNTQTDILKLLNIVRDRSDREAITAENLSTKSKGIISYLDTNNDFSRFPRIRYSTHISKMSPIQFAEYSKKYQEDKKKTKQLYTMSRRYATSTLHYRSNMKLSDFSSKIVDVLRNIKAHAQDKHYLYSTFFEKRGTQGVRAVGVALQRDEKYTLLTPAMAKTILKSFGTRNLGNNANASAARMKAKRFCYMMTTEIQNASDQKALLDLYNHERNKNGAFCHIMLASQKFNEGLDLKAVKHVHILEPLESVNAMKQTIGRARRNCSHSQFSNREQDWQVHIHSYLSEIPTRTNVHSPNRTNTQNVQQRVKQIQNDISQIKGKRGVEYKTRRDALQKNLKTYTKQLKALQKAKKKNTMVRGIGPVESIDHKILQKSHEEYKTIDNFHKIMKNNAIDCKVMQRFHNKNIPEDEVQRRITCL